MALKVGEKIKKYRIAAGLTQTELSKLSGVDQQTLSSWERGTAKPTRPMLKKVALCIWPATTTLEERPAKEGDRYVQTLAFFRAQKKLSVEELSRLSGVSESVISGIQNGKLPCVEPWVGPLARALGVKPGEIYNNLPGPIEHVGDDLKKLDAKYPAPPKQVNYWGGTATIKEVFGDGLCGWCKRFHDGLGCKGCEVR